MATDEQARARGYATPQPTDLISGGDDAIRQNARKSTDLWVAHDALAATVTANGRPVMSGTGQPEGVVTAPVGTLYTDTLGVYGAQLWRKATGTGNTGWTIIAGDTGVRSVTSMTGEGWVVNVLRLQRVGGTVSLFGQLRADEGFATTLLTLPAGFRPGHYVGAPVMAGANGRGFLLLYPTGAVNAVSVTAAPSGWWCLAATFTTSDPWPTILPGTPA